MEEKLLNIIVRGEYQPQAQDVAPRLPTLTNKDLGVDMNYSFSEITSLLFLQLGTCRWPATRTILYSAFFISLDNNKDGTSGVCQTR